MIKNLIFDFGKVLVDYDFMQVLRNHFQGYEDMEHFGALVTSDAFLDRCDKEEKPWEELMAEMKETYPQWKRHWDTFDEHYVQFVTNVMPGMQELLTELKAEGFKLYGLTNWCSKVHQVMANYPEIFSLLDGRIISSEEHLIKPEKAIYDRLVEKFGLKAEECLFADDKIVNIEGAKAAGWQAVLFTTAEQYKQDIREIREMRKGCSIK